MIKLWFSERSSLYPNILKYEYEKNEGLNETNKSLRYSLDPAVNMRQLYIQIINDLVVNNKEYVSFKDKHLDELKTILKENNIIVIVE